MDFEKILRAYMMHVMNEESFNYLIWPPSGQNPALKVLSADEYATLLKIGEEVEKEYAA